MLGLCFCARAFSSCGERGPLLITVRGPLTIAASLVAEHRLQTRRLSSCGSRTELLRGMWDPPRPGLEPASPALAGRFSTTAPPGKPDFTYIYAESILLLPNGNNTNINVKLTEFESEKLSRSLDLNCSKMCGIQDSTYPNYLCWAFGSTEIQLFLSPLHPSLSNLEDIEQRNFLKVML